MTVDCAKHPPAWRDMVKSHRAADDTNPAGTMLETVTFGPVGTSRTRVTIRTRMISAGDPRVDDEDGHDRRLVGKPPPTCRELARP